MKKIKKYKKLNSHPLKQQQKKKKKKNKDRRLR